jgi:hypothetical protein
MSLHQSSTKHGIVEFAYGPWTDRKGQVVSHDESS